MGWGFWRGAEGAVGRSCSRESLSFGTDCCVSTCAGGGVGLAGRPPRVDGSFWMVMSAAVGFCSSLGSSSTGAGGFAGRPRSMGVGCWGGGATFGGSGFFCQNTPGRTASIGAASSSTNEEEEAAAEEEEVACALRACRVEPCGLLSCGEGVRGPLAWGCCLVPSRVLGSLERRASKSSYSSATHNQKA